MMHRQGLMLAPLHNWSISVVSSTSVAQEQVSAQIAIVLRNRNYDLGDSFKILITL